MTPPLSTRSAALLCDDESARLAAALAIGSHPEPELADLLVARCAVEPNFYVRDMLTWALTRYPAAVIVPKLLAELRSDTPQAKSQALHTLSKIGDATVFPAITSDLLRDPDEEVARSAWRAAVRLVPVAQKTELAEVLATQLGRGDGALQRSLSRAFLALGGEVAAPVLATALQSRDEAVKAHAVAADRLLRDPDAGFEPDLQDARRRFVLGKDRAP